MNDIIEKLYLHLIKNIPSLKCPPKHPMVDSLLINEAVPYENYLRIIATIRINNIEYKEIFFLLNDKFY